MAYVLFVLFGVFVLVDTYLLGFHSLRQILYGTTIGVSSFFLYSTAMDTVIRIPHYEHFAKTQTAVYILLVFFSVSHISFVVYDVFFAVTKVYTFGKLLMHVLPASVLLVAVLFVAQKIKK